MAEQTYTAAEIRAMFRLTDNAFSQLEKQYLQTPEYGAWRYNHKAIKRIEKLLEGA